MLFWILLALCLIFIIYKSVTNYFYKKEYKSSQDYKIKQEYNKELDKWYDDKLKFYGFRDSEAARVWIHNNVRRVPPFYDIDVFKWFRERIHWLGLDEIEATYERIIFLKIIKNGPELINKESLAWYKDQENLMGLSKQIVTFEDKMFFVIQIYGRPHFSSYEDIDLNLGGKYNNDYYHKDAVSYFNKMDDWERQKYLEEQYYSKKTILKGPNQIPETKVAPVNSSAEISLDDMGKINVGNDP
jgi:hypothetical protein